MRASDEQIAGAEALLRWTGKELGSVSPATFIPIAEETGLIVPIGEWVFETACEQCRQWSERFGDMAVSVNLSLRQLFESRFIERIRRIVRETGVDPRLMEWEITESIMMRNAEEAMKKINILKDIGFSVSIDDFGMGYSSFSQLKRITVDALKIDASFVREIPHNKSDMEISEAIIALGKSLGMKIVAEGVETKEQLRFLQERNCDFIQGYYFSKPLPPQEFEGAFFSPRVTGRQHHSALKAAYHPHNL
jgi:EAL domain-containing protein (putative c-di-GMP-specific phosphodiesterase class I)